MYLPGSGPALSFQGVRYALKTTFACCGILGCRGMATDCSLIGAERRLNAKILVKCIKQHCAMQADLQADQKRTLQQAARIDYTKLTYSKDCFLTAVSNITIKWQGVNVHTFWPSANSLLRISGIIAKGCAVDIAVVQSHRQGE